MPGFVADASATLPWRFEDEATPWTEALLDRVESGEEVVVPAHWPIEVTQESDRDRRTRRKRHESHPGSEIPGSKIARISLNAVSRLPNRQSRQ